MKHLQSGKVSDLVYDVGMHKGEDTDYYLKKGFRVIGFEANPDLVLLCKNRFKRELEKGDLTIVEGAIVDKAPEKGEKVTFYKNSNSVWGTVVLDFAERNERLGTVCDPIEVPSVDFSECLNNYGIPYYLKIDIEGMDVHCLQTLLSFSTRPDFISIESGKRSFESLTEEIDLMIKLGYASFQAVNQAGVKNQSEPEHSTEGRYLNYEFKHGSSGLFGSDLPDDWKSRKELLQVYNKVFRRYHFFGDYGIFRKTWITNFLVKALFGFAIPGWYDTHARHGSVEQLNSETHQHR